MSFVVKYISTLEFQMLKSAAVAKADNHQISYPLSRQELCNNITGILLEKTSIGDLTKRFLLVNDGYIYLDRDCWLESLSEDNKIKALYNLNLWSK